jgi:hypothetical protein
MEGEPVYLAGLVLVIACGAAVMRTAANGGHRREGPFGGLRPVNAAQRAESGSRAAFTRAPAGQRR